MSAGFHCFQSMYAFTTAMSKKWRNSVFHHFLSLTVLNTNETSGLTDQHPQCGCYNQPQPVVCRQSIIEIGQSLWFSFEPNHDGLYYAWWKTLL